MAVDNEVRKFRFQPHEGKRLNLVDNMMSWTYFILNNLLFLSFHISHVVVYQIRCKIDCRTVEQLPPTKPNWMRWSVGSYGKTEQTPNQRWINCQTSPKILQCKNRWVEDSSDPQSPTHNLSSAAITPQRILLYYYILFIVVL